MRIPEVKLANGILIPLIGLGTWQLKGESCISAVKTAYRLGYRHIDTAELYNNHKEIGKAIHSYKREQIFLTSKVLDDVSYEGVITACNKAIEQMQCEYIDLYLIHAPDKNIAITETMRALKDLHDQKKILAVGVSNFTIKHLRAALDITKVPIVVNQVEFHAYLYQKELLDFCKKNKIQIVAYSPLISGAIVFDDLFIDLGKKYKKTPAQISLRWILDKGCVIIPKASSEKHLQENLELDFKLSAEDTAKLDSLTKQRFIDAEEAEFE